MSTGSSHIGPKFKRVNTIDTFLALDFLEIWRFFKSQSFAAWMICLYFLFEYTRPQSIFPGISVIPWMQVFLLLSAFGLVLLPKKDEVERSWVLTWLLIFFTVILLSSVNAYIPSAAWQSLDKYYIWVVVFFLISRIVTDERLFFILIIIFFLASFKLSFFGARTWALRGFSFSSWGIKGPPGYFQNPGELAVQMVFFFGLSYYFFLAAKPFLSGWKYWLVLSAPVTAAMTIMAANSRGSQVALAVQLYFVFLHKRFSIKALCVAGIVGIAVFHLIPDQQIERFTEIGEDRTSQQRLLYWKNGWEIMKTYPLLGVGHYNFVPYFAANYPEDMLYEGGELAHNIFIQVGADLGFLGLAVYGILIWLGLYIPRAAVKRLERHNLHSDWRIQIAKGLSLGFVGFIVAGQFVSIVYYPFMWIHLALCCVLSSSITKSLVSGINAAHTRRPG